MKRGFLGRPMMWHRLHDNTHPFLIQNPQFFSRVTCMKDPYYILVHFYGREDRGVYWKTCWGWGSCPSLCHAFTNLDPISLKLALLVLGSPVFWFFDPFFELEHCHKNSPPQLGSVNTKFQGRSSLFSGLRPEKFPFREPQFHWGIFVATC